MLLRRWLASSLLLGLPLVQLSRPPVATTADPRPATPDIKPGDAITKDQAKLLNATTPSRQSAAPGGSAQPAAAASALKASADAPSQYANLLDEECPWCISMRSGPCGKQFATWQRCVKDIRAEQESRAGSSLSSFSLSAAERQKRDELEYQRECMDYFRRLHNCIHRSAQSRRYYSQLINLRRDEEEREELGEDEDGWPDDDD